MTHLIQPKVENCGNCRYSRLITIGQSECWGVPGTPVVLGGKPNIAGQVEMQIEVLQPRVPSNRARCALWEERPAVDLNVVAQQGAA